MDGCGKTTQIKLLEIGSDNLFYFTKPLVKYTDRWPQGSGEEVAKWWFEDVEITEFISIIINSLNERAQSCPDGMIPIFDRGVKMFKAVCAATCATRLDGEVMDFIEDVDRRFSDGLNFAVDEVELFLRPSLAYFESVSQNISISASRPVGNYSEKSQKRYALYQRNLSEAVSFYFNQGSPVVINIDACIIDVQNAIRDSLNGKLNISLDPLARNLEKIVGLGGMSECGKSSFGDHLRLNHEFYRIKIRYFSQMLKSRGITPSPSEIAMEFIRFIEAHYYVRRFSLESLHSPDFPAFFKLLFGDRYKTVFIDTDFDKRVERTLAGTNASVSDVEMAIRVKDEKKLACEALSVGHIADIVFDNNSDDLAGNLVRFSKQLSL
ncbi:MAG TPA: hypothetical protein VF817_00975 [Patescibacteria group bacterium]